MIPAARPEIGDEERAAVDRVLRSGMLAQGPEVAAFEEEFSKLVGGRHCIAMNSGTSSLHLGFIAGGIKPGDEDRKSTRLNSSHSQQSRMPSSA